MKRYCTICLGVGLGLSTLTAVAENTVMGMNFVVLRPTTISEIGISDNGVPFTTDVNVGIFNSATGGLVGPEVTFGPGLGETQVGNTAEESVQPFVLQPGEYSVVALGAAGSISGGNSGLADIDSFQNLGNTLNLPGAGRFNSGTLFDVSDYSSQPNDPGTHGLQSFTILDPVPDGGSTAAILGSAFVALGWLRRKLIG